MEVVTGPRGSMAGCSSSHRGARGCGCLSGFFLRERYRVHIIGSTWVQVRVQQAREEGHVAGAAEIRPQLERLEGTLREREVELEVPHLLGNPHSPFPSPPPHDPSPMCPASPPLHVLSHVRLCVHAIQPPDTCC